MYMKKDMYCEQVCIAHLGRGEQKGMQPNKVVKAIRRQYVSRNGQTRSDSDFIHWLGASPWLLHFSISSDLTTRYHNNWIVDNLPSAHKVEFDGEDDPETRFWHGFPVGYVSETDKKAYVNNHVNLEIMYHPVEHDPSSYRIVRFTVEPFSIAHDTDDVVSDKDKVASESILPMVASIKNPIPSCAINSKEHTTIDMVSAPGRSPQLASGKVLFTYE